MTLREDLLVAGGIGGSKGAVRVVAADFARGLTRGNPSTFQVSELLDVIYEMIEEEWTESDHRDEYLEAIGIARVSLVGYSRCNAILAAVDVFPEVTAGEIRGANGWPVDEVAL